MIGLAIALPTAPLSAAWGDHEVVAEILSVDGLGSWHGGKLVVCSLTSEVLPHSITLPAGHVYLPTLPVYSRLAFTLTAEEFHVACLERRSCTLTDFRKDSLQQFALPPSPLTGVTAYRPLSDWFSWASFNKEWTFAEPRLGQLSPVSRTQVSQCLDGRCQALACETGNTHHHGAAVQYCALRAGGSLW
jgi:hypothetical protein